MACVRVGRHRHLLQCYDREAAASPSGGPVRGRPGRRGVSPATAAPECLPCPGQLRQHLDPSRECRGLLQPALAGGFPSDRVIDGRNTVASLHPSSSLFERLS